MVSLGASCWSGEITSYVHSEAKWAASGLMRGSAACSRTLQRESNQRPLEHSSLFTGFVLNELMLLWMMAWSLGESWVIVVTCFSSYSESEALISDIINWIFLNLLPEAAPS